jgi:signal transduction histidine kinase
MTTDDATVPRPASPVALVLAPVVAIVLVSVALSVVLVTRHVGQIRAGLIDRAHTITQFMARDAALGILSHDDALLRHLTSLAVMQDDVLYVSIHDALGEQITRRGEKPPVRAALARESKVVATGLRLFTSRAGWELRAPLRTDAGEVGHIRLGISHETLDRERSMAVTTALVFTIFVTFVASAGAVIFTRRHLATLLAGAALAEEHERVADLKARILTQASHEFRTPLTIIMSAGDVLQRYGERLTTEQRSARFEKIRGAVHHLTDLLDDMLMIGRADASRFVPVPTDLVQLCRLALEHALALAQAPLQVTAVLPASPLEAVVDPFLLGQALRALLANAVRYSPGGGTVTLALAATETEVRFMVSDEGIGIPREDLPRLFEPFQRASNVGTIPGSGLGLAIAQRAIAVHGGRIDARSAPGAGSTFTVVLPAACLSASDRSAA